VRAARPPRPCPGGGPGADEAQGLGRRLRGGPVGGRGGRPNGGARPGDLVSAVRPLRLPPGRVAGHEGRGRPPPAVRRPRRAHVSNPQTSQQLASGSRPRADALVLFGATGDLAYKQLFPSLYPLAARTVLSGRPIAGVTI